MDLLPRALVRYGKVAGVELHAGLCVVYEYDRSRQHTPTLKETDARLCREPETETTLATGERDDFLQFKVVAREHNTNEAELGHEFRRGENGWGRRYGTRREDVELVYVQKRLDVVEC